MTSGGASTAAPWPVRRDLLALALLALAVRLTFMWAGLQTHDLSGVAMVASDSNVFTQLSQHYRGETVVDPSYLLVACPGYPLLLAGLTAVFGAHLEPAVLLNVLLGSLAAVVVYLIAAALILCRKVAMLSGLWAALSFTGLSMSTSLLTDQPFYTLHALGLLLFIWGLQSGQARWFVASGLAATLALAVRPLSQPWPWIFILLAAGWVAAEHTHRNWWVFLKSLSVPALLVAFTLSWSFHNAETYGVFAFTTNGVRATWAYLVATAVADHSPGANLDSVRTAWSGQVLAPMDGQPPSEATVHERMKSQMFGVLFEHPGWLLDSYVDIVWQNTRAPNYFAEAQVPQWTGFWRALCSLGHDRVNPLLLFFTILGWVLLVRRRKWQAALVLGVTYAYFTLTTGFSFWQGSRLHFPAEMAWAILVSYVLVSAWTRWRGTRYVRDEAVSA